jgi:hypothetical protein
VCLSCIGLLFLPETPTQVVFGFLVVTVFGVATLKVGTVGQPCSLRCPARILSPHLQGEGIHLLLCTAAGATFCGAGGRGWVCAEQYVALVHAPVWLGVSDGRAAFGRVSACILSQSLCLVSVRARTGVGIAACGPHVTHAYAHPLSPCACNGPWAAKGESSSRTRKTSRCSCSP